MDLISGMPVMWESTQTPGRFFYGRVLSVHSELTIYGGAKYAMVKDRNFRTPIAVRIDRVKVCSNKDIDTSSRPRQL